MAGYSGTPLVKKIGIKPGHAVVFRNQPPDWQLPDLPPDTSVSDDDVAGADIVVAFFTTRHDLEQGVPSLLQVRPASSLWIAWPRKAAGHVSDITENLLRELLLPTGMVDVKVAALGTDWSGLKFVWRKENR